ncbi:cell division protein FtsK, partial [Streptococcus suis]
MKNNQLEQYLLQSLNRALGSLIQGETRYSNSFSINVNEDGFLFIPRMP